MADRVDTPRLPVGAKPASGADARLAVAAAYRAHRDYILGVLAHRCGWLDAAEREALLHDAVVVVLEKLARGTLDVDSLSTMQLRAYLLQTAIHKALDVGRRAERRRTEPLADGEALARVADPRPGPEEQLVARQEAAAVRAIVAELPARQRAVVTLRHLLGLSPRAIEGRLGISRRTYRRQLERAMRTISRRDELTSGLHCPRGGRDAEVGRKRRIATLRPNLSPTE